MVIIDALITHRRLIGDSTSTRIATTLSSAPMAATAAAQRMAVFHSTWRGLGGGMVPVVAPLPSADIASPPVSADWFASDRKSCGGPQGGQNGDPPLSAASSPPHR